MYTNGNQIHGIRILKQEKLSATASCQLYLTFSLNQSKIDIVHEKNGTENFEY